MPSTDPVVIVAAARTPIGGLQGNLSSLSASALGAAALAEVTRRTRLASDAVDEVIMGCVLPAGQGQAPARQAALAAGLGRGRGRRRPAPVRRRGAWPPPSGGTQGGGVTPRRR